MAQWPALDGFALGFPFLDFLVGEYRAHGRGPVDRCLVDKGEADIVDLFAAPALGFEFGDRSSFLSFLVKVGVIELEEDPLGPANVVGVGGVDFAVPVIAEAKGFELAPEVVDILLGGDAWVLTGFDGVLLGR